MKCEYCGSNLGIEDAVCPYCGKENKFVKKHTKDMRKYNAAFDSTRAEVLANSKKFNSFTARITVIAVLVALIAATMLGISSHYDIREYREERIVAKHATEHRTQVNKLMDADEYMDLYHYMQRNRISYSEVIPEYYMVYNACHTYYSFMEYMNYLLDEDSYIDDSDAIESVTELVDRLHGYANPTSEYEIKKYYDDRTRDFINRVEAHVNTLVKGYFNLTDEEMESFYTLNKAKKQLLLEEGYARGK